MRHAMLLIPMKLRQPAYLILGMLRLGAGTGYEIKRRVEVSTRYFSTISQVQIYPLLKELEQAGLLRGQADNRGGRRRRLYDVTSEGEAALVEWIEREEPLDLELRDVGLLKVFFADAVDRPQALELVRRLRHRSERILEDLQQRSEGGASELDDAGARFPLLTLGFGKKMHEAWIEHCRELEGELAQ